MEAGVSPSSRQISGLLNVVVDCCYLFVCVVCCVVGVLWLCVCGVCGWCGVCVVVFVCFVGNNDTQTTMIENRR